MRVFTMENPTKVYFGEGAISHLGTEIKLYGKKVLLVYGQGSIKRSGIYDAVMAQFDLMDIAFVELGGVQANPRLSTVVTGAEICRAHKVALVLAVGGGSVIDCAKAIAAAACYDGDPWRLMTYEDRPTKALPVATVLTLAGTGSEMNHQAVITNEATKEKVGWKDGLLFPRFSIMDSAYTHSVSRHQTACGIVTMLAHLFEPYFSIEEDEDYIAQRMGETVMRTVVKFGKTAILEPEHDEARANLMWAASLAQSGYVNRFRTSDGFTPLVARAISAQYDSAYADGLAVLIPAWMGYVLDDKRCAQMADFARNVWGVSEEEDRLAAPKGIERTKRFFEFLDMPTTLSHLGVEAESFEAILDQAFGSRDNIGHFRQLSKQDGVKILTEAL